MHWTPLSLICVVISRSKGFLCLLSCKRLNVCSLLCLPKPLNSVCLINVTASHPLPLFLFVICICVCFSVLCFQMLLLAQSLEMCNTQNNVKVDINYQYDYYTLLLNFSYYLIHICNKKRGDIWISCLSQANVTRDFWFLRFPKKQERWKQSAGFVQSSRFYRNGVE